MSAGLSNGEEQVRGAELVAALCLATDLGMGFPFEHGLHTALIAMRLGDRLGVDRSTASQTYYGCLLSHAGCTTDAHEEIFAVERRLAEHRAVAAGACPSLVAKKVTLHVLRHTAAMRLLHAGVDTSVIALWLGHEHVDTTQIYLHADLALKQRALARTTPPDTRPGRYRPSDTLLAFLQSL